MKNDRQSISQGRSDNDDNLESLKLESFFKVDKLSERGYAFDFEKFVRVHKMEALNRLMLNLLLYFAERLDNEEEHSRLSAIQNEQDWITTWLGRHKWVSHLFLRDILLGERVLAEAKLAWINHVKSYNQDFASRLKEMTNRVVSLVIKDDEGKSKIPKDALNDITAVFDSETNSDVIKRNLLSLRAAMLHEPTDVRMKTYSDVLQKLKNTIPLSGNEDIRKLFDWFCGVYDHMEMKSVYPEIYEILAAQPGSYEVAEKPWDARRRDEISEGFERNLMIVGFVQAVVRAVIDKEYDELDITGESWREYEALKKGNSADEICKCEDRVKFIPKGTFEAIAAGLRLDDLMQSILFSETSRAFSELNVRGRRLRDWGVNGEEIFGGKNDNANANEFKYDKALEARAYIHGGGLLGKPFAFLERSDLETRKRPNLKRLKELKELWVNDIGNVDGIAANIPMLRYIEGGFIPCHVVSYLHDIVVMSINKALGGIVIDRSGGPNSPDGSGEGDEPDGWGQGRDWSGKPGGPRPDPVPGEFEDEREFALKVLEQMRSFDLRLFLYAGSLWFGVNQIMSYLPTEEQRSLALQWQKSGGLLEVVGGKSIARTISGINNNTNFVSRKIPKFIAALTASNKCIEGAVLEKIKQILNTL